MRASSNKQKSNESSLCFLFAPFFFFSSPHSLLPFSEERTGNRPIAARAAEAAAAAVRKESKQEGASKRLLQQVQPALVALALCPAGQCASAPVCRLAQGPGSKNSAALNTRLASRLVSSPRTATATPS